MSAQELGREALPVEHVCEGGRNPEVTVMTGHGRSSKQTVLVLTGPEGGELVVPFDRVRIDAERHRLVLTRLRRSRVRLTEDYNPERYQDTGSDCGDGGELGDE